MPNQELLDVDSVEGGTDFWKESVKHAQITNRLKSRAQNGW